MFTRLISLLLKLFVVNLFFVQSTYAIALYQGSAFASVIVSNNNPDVSISNPQTDANTFADTTPGTDADSQAMTNAAADVDTGVLSVDLNYSGSVSDPGAFATSGGDAMASFDLLYTPELAGCNSEEFCIVSEFEPMAVGVTVNVFGGAAFVSATGSVTDQFTEYAEASAEGSVEPLFIPQSTSGNTSVFPFFDNDADTPLSIPFDILLNPGEIFTITLSVSGSGFASVAANDTDVPEPGTLLLLGVSVLGLGGRKALKKA